MPPYTFTPGLPSPGRAALLRHPFSLPTAGLVRTLRQAPPKGHPPSGAQHRRSRHGRDEIELRVNFESPYTTDPHSENHHALRRAEATALDNLLSWSLSLGNPSYTC
jgi:hypothetical protein